MTFFFSDIEGSTDRWERVPDAMAAAVARHDLLMQAAIERHGGYTFKTAGDAFCAAFATAPSAIEAALAAQCSLATEDFSAVGTLRVRIAIHTGHSDERDGDYFGSAVNRVARLLAIGHGGQILVSGAATNLLDGELPARTTLHDLGVHRLKDLTRPEQVYQLVVPDLPQVFPPVNSLDTPPNNLPRQLTSFVGRDVTVAEIKALIETAPLVTLIGAGGAGKTRCAVQVGTEVLERFRDGVCFVELAPTSDTSLVTTIIAQALGIPESTDRPAVDTVLAFLKRKRLLMIADNCEHLIDEVRRVAAAILRGCPGVRILATSREALNIAGEQVFRMPSLSAEDSMKLFIDRACPADPRFKLTDENAPFVEEICRRLDGIPLALELAAARIKVLSPKQLARRLDQRFRVLTGGDRSALPRQQTMRALMDWSYDLLSEDERALFRKLSIFAGGFTLETAAAVCSDDSFDEIGVLDLFSSLVDKSLVHVEPLDGVTRYRLLESTRQYAREKLVELGEENESAAHAAAFLKLAEDLERTWETTSDRVWFAQADPEIENWRAALDWTLSAHGDLLLGQRLIGALMRIWIFPAPAEGRRWVRIALQAGNAPIPDEVVAKLHLAQAAFTSALGQHKASLASAQEALARYRKLGDPNSTALAQRFAGRALVRTGRVAQGEALLEQARATARASGQRKLEAYTLGCLGETRSFLDDQNAAREHYAQALATFNAVGAELDAAWTRINLAEAEFRAGDATKALRLAAEALAGLRDKNRARGTASAFRNMAAYLVALNRTDEARAAAREGLSLAQDAQSEIGLAWALQHLAAVGALEGKHSRAALLLGYVDARVQELEAVREYTEQHEYDTIVASLRDALGQDELVKRMNEGRTWSEDCACSEAMSM